MKKIIPYFFKLLSKISANSAAHLALKLFTHPRRVKRSESEMSFLKTGQQLTFKSKRKARVWGHGKVVVLLHGWESRGSTYYKLIPRLVNNGFQVIAWDAPAHGDSPGQSTHLPDYAHSLSTDMQDKLFDEPVAIIGHSFGGAALAVFSKIHTLPPKVIICSAPTRIQNIFVNFANTIKLCEKAQKHFIQQAELQSGYSLKDVSLINNDLSKNSDVLVIHDKQDLVIPYSDFQALKKVWQSGRFISTKKLGHRLTIKNSKILDVIVSFIQN